MISLFKRKTIQLTPRPHWVNPTWRSCWDSSSALDDERSESIRRSASSPSEALPGSAKSTKWKRTETIRSSSYRDVPSDDIVIVRSCCTAFDRGNNDWICSIRDHRLDDEHSCESWDCLWSKRLEHRCDNERDVRPYGCDSAFSEHFDRKAHVCKRRIRSNRF